jgi:hypothetical protein
MLLVCSRPETAWETRDRARLAATSNDTTWFDKISEIVKSPTNRCAIV